jgi:hypothetical protein
MVIPKMFMENPELDPFRNNLLASEKSAVDDRGHSIYLPPLN